MEAEITMACNPEKGRKCLQNVEGQAEGNRLLRRSMHRCEDNIKTCLKEVSSEGVDWIHLVHDRGLGLVNSVMNVRFPKNDHKHYLE
jgi:hypothetical protein